MPTPGSTKTEKRSAEEAVLAALAAAGETSAAEVASAAGVGRSTAAKCLAALERAGKVSRRPGGREAGKRRRMADRFSPVAAEEVPSSEPRTKGAGERLRPGQLDGLVLGYLREHAADGTLSPSGVGKGLGRSSGAVANSLKRLAEAGQVREVSKRPRRYATE